MLRRRCWALLLHRVGWVAFDAWDHSPIGRYGEVTELALALGLATYALLPLRRIRLGRHAPERRVEPAAS